MNNQENGINPDVKSLQDKLAAAEAAGAELFSSLKDAVARLDFCASMHVNSGKTSRESYESMLNVFRPVVERHYVFGTGWKSPAEFAAVVKERDEAVAYSEKLAQEMPDGMLPKDVENIRNANANMATEISRLRSEIERKDAALRLAKVAMTNQRYNKPRLEMEEAFVAAESALAPAEKEAAAHNQHIIQQGKPDPESVESVESAHKQYRDLVPGVDRWQEGDKIVTQEGELERVESGFGTLVSKDHQRGLRPLPEVPEGWTERVGDGVWVLPDKSEVEIPYLGDSVIWLAIHKDSIGKPSVKGCRYRLPWPPKEEAAQEPAPLWISQPTEPGLYRWKRVDSDIEQEVDISKNMIDAVACEPIEWRGQFQGPIKPQEGGK